MKQVGRYVIRDLLAEGPAGYVYLAYDPVIERNVVLKTLDKSLPAAGAPELAARFRREAIAAGRLTHPNIVTIYEAGELPGLSYIAMEHAPGRTLKQFLQDEPAPQLETVHAIARQLFAAMTYAHDQGVLHRDLKPSNVVLVANASDEPQVKVLDFGIAKLDTAPELTQTGAMVGTLGYMSPEQCRGSPVDARTDLYSLALILFEMLVGKPLYRGSLRDVLEAVLHRDPPLVSALRPGTPSLVDGAFRRALARKPEDRFSSLQEFREAFGDAMASLLPVPDASLPSVVDITSPSALDLGSIPARSLTGPRARVLFLDDEERILNALSALFRLRYEVHTATDGETALGIVRDVRPDVIVSDQRMPRMQGVEFLRRARELQPASVRILLTGYSDLSAIVGSINEGEVFRFVNKPWSNQELKDTLAQAAVIAVATRDAAAPAKTEIKPQARATEAIVVADRGRDLFELLDARFGRLRPVCHATSMAAVTRAVEDQEVAVIVCDLESIDGAGVMLKVLKQSHPQIQALALADSGDAGNLIGLINQAQVFRFITRPLKIGLLEHALRSALAAFSNTKAQPVLAQRQKVETAPEAVATPLGKQILRRLSMLKLAISPRRQASTG